MASTGMSSGGRSPRSGPVIPIAIQEPTRTLPGRHASTSSRLALRLILSIHLVIRLRGVRPPLFSQPCIRRISDRTTCATGQKVRVGVEASGYARWFERVLEELQLALWIGDAAEIQSKRA